MAFIDDIKQYFQTGDYPTQAQFYEMFSKLRWKDEFLAIADVDGLQDILNSISPTGGVETYTVNAASFTYELPATNFDKEILLEKIIIIPELRYLPPSNYNVEINADINDGTTPYISGWPKMILPATAMTGEHPICIDLNIVKPKNNVIDMFIKVNITGLDDQCETIIKVIKREL